MSNNPNDPVYDPTPEDEVRDALKDITFILDSDISIAKGGRRTLDILDIKVCTRTVVRLGHADPYQRGAWPDDEAF